MKTVSIVKWDSGKPFPEIVLVKNVGIAHYVGFDNLRNKMRAYYATESGERLTFTARQLLNSRYGRDGL